jgi:hypothetical protein
MYGGQVQNHESFLKMTSNLGKNTKEGLLIGLFFKENSHQTILNPE